MAPDSGTWLRGKGRAPGLISVPTSYYLGGLAQVTCVFVPPFSHLSNDDIIPIPLRAVGRLHHTGQPPHSPQAQYRQSFAFPDHVSSWLGPHQRLALTGMCTLAAALWMMANPTREPEAQENTGRQVQGRSFHPIPCQT